MWASIHCKLSLHHAHLAPLLSRDLTPAVAAQSVTWFDLGVPQRYQSNACQERFDKCLYPFKSN
jgi:hypothetical protein